MSESGVLRSRCGLSRKAAAVAVLSVLVLLSGGPRAAADVTPPPSGGHSGDVHGGHGGMGGGAMEDGATYRRPEYLAAGALVRVETTARVSVAVELGGRLKHDINVPAREATTRTGFFVSPGAVVTSASPVRRMLGIYAVNQVFRDYLPRPLAQPFEATHASDPAIDRELQQCYRWLSPQSSCLVSIRPTVTVRPYTTDGKSLTVSATRADAQVTFLVLDCPDKAGCSLLTLPIQPAQTTGRYVAVAASGEDPLTPKVTGQLTGDHEAPLSPADVRTAEKTLGPTADGAPLMSDQGQVVGMIIREDSGFTALPAQHLVDDAAKQDVTPTSGTKNHHLYQGLAFLEKGDLEGAANLLDDVASTSHQTTVTALARDAQHRLDAAAPVSGTTGGRQNTAVADIKTGPSLWQWLLGTGVLIVVVAGALAGFARVRSRRRQTPDAASSDAPSTAATPAAAAAAPAPARTGTPAGTPVGASSRSARPSFVGTQREGGSVPTGGRSVDRGSRAPGYCTQCGAQLAPGDRFCFACGAPSYAPRPS